MKRNRLFSIAAFLRLAGLLTLLLTGYFLQAQNTVNVKEYSGTLSPYTISNVQKLTFGSGNFSITQNGGATNTYTLTNVRYVSFSATTTSTQSSMALYDLSAFPNPATDDIQLLYHCDHADQVDIEVKNLQGKIVKTESQYALAGDNTASLSLSDLPTGFYICTIRSGKAQQSLKFVKR